MQSEPQNRLNFENSPSSWSGWPSFLVIAALLASPFIFSNLPRAFDMLGF